ncbi:hypothetical protein ZWY2020_003392 [Hordeum vulgare]|nr:hypothetical protein ZWY2020_003392 [Hordeum vulgare]
MGVLSWPEEVAALVRLKVAAGRIRRQIRSETHWAFAYDMLQRVSRSFALGPELCNAMHQLKQWEEDVVQKDTAGNG